MRKVYISMLVMALSLSAMAERVAPNVAERVATNFLINNSAKSSGFAEMSSRAGFARNENSQWDGTLTNVALGKMYKIWMDNPSSISLQGTTTSGIQVAIVPGNNWFGCPTTKNVALADLGITPTDGDSITDKDGHTASYNGGCWTGDLTELLP